MDPPLLVGSVNSALRCCPDFISHGGGSPWFHDVCVVFGLHQYELSEEFFASEIRLQPPPQKKNLVWGWDQSIPHLETASWQPMLISEVFSSQYRRSRTGSWYHSSRQCMLLECRAVFLPEHDSVCKCHIEYMILWLLIESIRESIQWSILHQAERINQSFPITCITRINPTF